MKENFDFKAAFATIKNDFSRKNLPKTFLHLFLLVLGSFILAAGDEVFLIQNGIVTGGLSGIGILFNKALGWNTELTITIFQWVFFAIGFVFLGVSFSIKTLISSVLFPVFLYVFADIISRTSFFTINTGNVYLNDLLCGVIGGVLCGLGCGLTYLGGGSTGGVDNISLTISKYFHIKASVTSFIVDFAIIVSVMFLPQNDSIVPFLLGSISAYCCAEAIEKVYIGVNETYIAMIISSHWEKINDEINKELSRGTTLFDGYGGYTGEDKVLIQVAFTKDEYDELLKIVYRADPKAFLTVLKASEVTGYGFRKVPFKINREIKYEDSTQKKEELRRKLPESLSLVKRDEYQEQEKKTGSPKLDNTSYNSKAGNSIRKKKAGIEKPKEKD